MSTKIEPTHHVAYREAWEQYRQTYDDTERRQFEKAMDQAQEHFQFDEFQTFKATLPDFEACWAFMVSPENLKRKLNGTCSPPQTPDRL